MRYADPRIIRGRGGNECHRGNPRNKNKNGEVDAVSCLSSLAWLQTVGPTSGSHQYLCFKCICVHAVVMAANVQHMQHTVVSITTTLDSRVATTRRY